VKGFALKAMMVLALLCVTRPSWADVERFALLVGNNVGAPGEVELRYAESDAERIHDTLRALGGFDPANLVLLKGENAEAMRKAMARVLERVRAAAAKPGTQTVLVTYYSGHADGMALHLGSTNLPMAEVEQAVRGSSAEFRLLILDSCRSGALTRVKGGTQAPPVDIRSDNRLSGEGLLFWTSSAANEDAQESDALRGSFFSHYLNSAMVGAADVDGDGRITIEEAYRYASENTIRASSATFGGTQHPTFHYELQGNGKLALTTLWDRSSERATLVAPAGKPYLVFVRSSSGSVVGEIAGSDAARKISVRPGTYFVRARAPDALLEGQVRVAAGESHVIRDDELDRTAYARLIRKGGGARSASFMLGAGVSLHTRLSNATGACLGGYAEAGVHWEALTGSVRLGACRAPFENRLLNGHADEATFALRASKVLDLPFISPYVAVEAGAVLFKQTFDNGRVSSENPATFAVSAAGALGFSLDLPKGFGVTAECAFTMYAYQIEDSLAVQDKRRADFAVRPALGLSKSW
jgi:hypothetical protein